MWRRTQVLGIAALVWLIALFIGLDVPAQTSGTLDSGQQFDVSQAFGPGDVKEGYESADYETQSRSLLSRRGIKQDLIQIVESPPLGLPPVAFPADNPITRAKIDLGASAIF